jgi:hypothetical protein
MTVSAAEAARNIYFGSLVVCFFLTWLRGVEQAAVATTEFLFELLP